MINKRAVARHFTGAVDSYNTHTAVQYEMAHTLMGLLPESCNPSRILEIGSGTGYLSRLLQASWPQSNLTILDISAAMIEKCKRELNQEYLTCCVGDGESIDTVLFQETELLISSACFQWYNDPIATVAGYLNNLPQNAVLAFSTFGPETFRELHAAFAAAYHKLQKPYRRVQGQSFPGAEAWSRGLAGNGRLPVIREAYRTVYYDSVRDFLRAVRAAGANNALTGPERTPMDVLKLMPEIYRSRFQNSEGKIPVTYHLLFAVTGIMQEDFPPSL